MSPLRAMPRRTIFITTRSRENHTHVSLMSVHATHTRILWVTFFCVCDIFTDPEKDTSEKDTCYTDSCYTEPCSTDSCHTDTNQGKPKCALMCLQDQWCQSIKDGIGDSGYAERGFFLIRDMGPWLSHHWNPCSLYMRKMVLHVGFCRMATEISPFLISPPGGSN